MQKRPEAATIEHLQRKADGGTDHPSNIAMACKRCNDERGSTPWNEYKSFRRGEFAEFMAAIRRP